MLRIATRSIPSLVLTIRLVTLAFLAIVVAPGLAGAALFDIGDGPVLDGWTGIDPTVLTATDADGIELSISATAAAGIGDRDRGNLGNGGGDESDMWRDFVFAVSDPGNDVSLVLDLSGLTPLAEYDVSIWSFDSAGAQVDTRLSEWNGESYSFIPRGDLPDTLEDNVIIVRVMADAGGLAQVVGLSREPSDPGVFVSGVGVALVPEPSTALLFGLGLAALARRPPRAWAIHQPSTRVARRA